jgi:hypothetical protein
MKVGDKVWLFDSNRRVYPKDNKFSSAPIFSEHFHQVIIDGETSRSWLIGREKFSKTHFCGIYTDEQKADLIWKEDNQQKIIEEIRNCSINKLREINSILNK